LRKLDACEQMDYALWYAAKKMGWGIGALQVFNWSNFRCSPQYLFSANQKKPHAELIADS
jgi:hypothetical protein